MNITIEERWVAISLGGVAMERISLPFFYKLGVQLNALTKFIPEVKNRVQIWRASFPAHEYVYALLTNFQTLAVCNATGAELTKAIVEMQEWMRKTPYAEWGRKNPIVDVKFSNVVNKAKEFETVLSAELQTLETYHVSQKGIYDTTALIARAEKILPIPMLKKVDEKVVTEIRESGKCLAFDCATAAGFHIMRAVELVMHEYYIHVCKPESKNRLSSWGAYITKLDKVEGIEVKEIIAMLRQIKDRHRNLIMHPEIVLTPDEAFTLFELGKGAVIAMADRLPVLKKT